MGDRQAAYHSNTISTISVTRSTSGLVCDYAGCKRTFKTKEQLAQHRVDSHRSSKHCSSPIIGRLVCNHGGCKKVFDTEEQLVQHRSDSHQQRSRKLACYQCGAKFVEQLDLHNHQRSSPGHTQVLDEYKLTHSRCKLCLQTFETPLDLDNHFRSAHAVSILSKSDELYRQVEEYFNRKWSHSGPKGCIEDILEIYGTGHKAWGFESYRNEIKKQENERTGTNKDNRIMENGNEVQRFHGTRVCCKLGIDGQSKLCNSTQCSLCSIIRSGFKMRKARTHAFQRFGPGIYVTATSSKADSYVRDEQGEGRKAMLCCRVLAGRVFKLESNRQQLLGSPPGYNSVSGEVGRDLNYDELVLYDDRAILPEFIIIYSSSEPLEPLQVPGVNAKVMGASPSGSSASF